MGHKTIEAGNDLLEAKMLVMTEGLWRDSFPAEGGSK